MSNVIALQPISPRDYNGAQLALIKRTVAADCNDAEFALYIEAARRIGLDPFKRQIYAVVYSKKDPEKRKMSIITGIDGFRAVAARNRDYRPDDRPPEITYLDELKDAASNPLGIEKAVVRAFKLAPNGEWHPVVGVAYWQEYAPLREIWEYSEGAGKRQPTGVFELEAGSMWRRMGRIMICKAAEAQALRRGWPEDMSGVYVEEEMAQATNLDASAAVEQHETQKRLALVGAKDAIPIQWAAGQPIEMVPAGQVADRALAFARASESPTEIQAWQATNAAGLREFWALHKSDALGLKKGLEDRVEELSKA